MGDMGTDTVSYYEAAGLHDKVTTIFWTVQALRKESLLFFLIPL